MQMQAGRPEAFEGDVSAVNDRELHKIWPAFVLRVLRVMD
jgi:hypothetical protein